jgi:hypothetical protein
VSKPALRPTQPPVESVPGVQSSGLKRGRGVTLTTNLHLVPRSRMSSSYTFSPLSAFVAYSGIALAFLSFQMHYAFSNQFIDGFKQPVKMTSHFGTKRSSKILKVHPVRVMRFRKYSFSQMYHCSAIKRCLYAFTLLCQWMDGQTGMCWTSIN